LPVTNDSSNAQIVTGRTVVCTHFGLRYDGIILRNHMAARILYSGRRMGM
jgi:hypothetical protein